MDAYHIGAKVTDGFTRVTKKKMLLEILWPSLSASAQKIKMSNVQVTFRYSQFAGG